MSPLDPKSNRAPKLPIRDGNDNLDERKNIKSAADALIQMGVKTTQINNKKRRYDHLPLEDVPANNLQKRTRTYSPPPLKLFKSVFVTPRLGTTELLIRYKHGEINAKNLPPSLAFDDLPNKLFVHSQKIDNINHSPKIDASKFQDCLKDMEIEPSLKQPPKSG